MSLASKNFARLAWPALYRKYSSWPLGNGNTIPTYYLRTLCLKPEHGKALRSLAIDAQPPIGASGLEDEDLYELLLGDAMTMALFQWRARNFWLGGYPGGEDVHEKLVRSLVIGLDEGIMALVLLMCPNITELDISMPEKFETSVLGLMLLLVTLSDGDLGPLPDDPIAYEPPPAAYFTSQMFGAAWPDKIWQQPLALRQLQELTLRNGDIDISWELLRGVSPFLACRRQGYMACEAHLRRNGPHAAGQSARS